MRHKLCRSLTLDALASRTVACVALCCCWLDHQRSVDPFNRCPRGFWVIIWLAQCRWIYHEGYHCSDERDDVLNHWRFDCLLNRLFRRGSKKNQRSALLAFVRGIHRSLVNSPHKGPVTREMFPFDDVIVVARISQYLTTIKHNKARA